MCGSGSLVLMDLRRRLLLVDDDRATHTLIGSLALIEGFEVNTAMDASDALAQRRKQPADLVLLDVRMPDASELDVLRSIREISPQSGVILMADGAAVGDGVEAVKRGALD